MLTRGQVIGWSTFAAVAGVAVLVYLLLNVSPFFPDGTANSAALMLFLVGLLATVAGLGGLVALALHRHWPVLSGVRGRKRTPPPGVALRQGVLVALAVGILAVLAYLHMLDIAFVLVTIVLVGLLEAFLQSQGR